MVRAQRENGENGFDVGLEGHLKPQLSSSRYQLRAALTFKFQSTNTDERRVLAERSRCKSGRGVGVGATVKENGKNTVTRLLFGFRASLERFLAERARCNETLHGGQDGTLMLDITSQKWIYAEEMANPPGYMGLNQSGQTAEKDHALHSLNPRHSRGCCHPPPPTPTPPSVLRLDCERGGDGEEELSQLFILSLSPLLRARAQSGVRACVRAREACAGAVGAGAK